MKNTIVYWKGGGYSGCVWEPNMGFFDGDGKWHPVISTGCGALDTKEDVEAEMKKQENPNVPDYKKTGLLTFPIEGEHPLEWMCEHVRIDYVAVLADALVKAGYSVDMKCDCCGEWFSYDEDDKFADIIRTMENSGFYTGDGGIGTITTAIWCDDCRRNSECPACCEIRLPSRKVLEDRDYWKYRDFADKFAYDELGICEYCWERFQYRHDGHYNSSTQEYEFSKSAPKDMERLPNGIKVFEVLENLEATQEKKSERWDASFLDGMRKYAKWQTDEGMSRADVETALVRQMLVPTDDGVNYLMKVPSAFAYGAVRNVLIPLALKYFGYQLDHIEFEPTDLTEFWKEVFNG